MANMSVRFQRAQYIESKQNQSLQDILTIMRGHDLMALLNAKKEDKLVQVSLILQ
jgi:hypothetical protein